MLEQIDGLLRADDTDALYMGAADILGSVLREYATQLAHVEDCKAIDRDLVLRGIVIRAAEGWESILCLLRSGHPHAAVALLRPLTEELIFGCYLLELPPQDVDRYLAHKTMAEIWEKLIAQHEFFPAMAARFAFKDIPPREVNHELVAATREAISRARKEIREMSKQSGWPVGKSQTVRDMASAADLEPLYSFIYRASSSAVHASLHELGRMVWGDAGTGKFEISFRVFAPHYRRFVLVYGAWVASCTAHLVGSHFSKLVEKDTFDTLGMIMALCIKPAIGHESPALVRTEELEWPDTQAN